MTQLSIDQENAVNTFLDFLLDPEQKVMVLQGAAGTGKSFLIRYFIEVAKNHLTVLNTLLDDKKNLHFSLTATTNKAAEVLSTFAELPACSIHSFLNLFVQDDYREGKQILRKSGNFSVVQNCLLIIDEASMTDRHLFKIIGESTLNCKTLYVGDTYQLPPVFESNSPVFSQGYLTVDLNTQHRQANISDLEALAIQFRNSVDTKVFQPIKTNNTNIIHLNGEDFQNQIIQNFSNSTNHKDNKILVYTNNKAVQYNKFVKSLKSNSLDPYVGELLISNGVIKRDEKTIISNNQLVRIKEMSPGEFSKIAGWYCTIEILGGLGNVIACVFNVFVPQDFEEVQAYMKHYATNKDWNNHFMLKNRVADFRQIHASTIHKAQGDTFKNTFINLNDIGKCNDPNLVARMLYVAFTRATDNIYIYGELPKKYGGACV